MCGRFFSNKVYFRSFKRSYIFTLTPMHKLRPFFSILLLGLLASCKPQPKAYTPYELAQKGDLQGAFEQSVKDAAITEAVEISDKLWAITPSNKNLIRDEEGRVLMLTWTNWTGYQEKVGQAMTLTREIWATPTPQVQNFCTKVEKETLVLRLEQLLGLPPHNGKTHFVEFWVNPQDLFRPCPDAEITDQRCELDYPENTREAHKAWIEKLRDSSFGENGYPWTQLGYTYDWGNPKSPVGMSEYIVREGAAVKIKSFTPTHTYCEE